MFKIFYSLILASKSLTIQSEKNKIPAYLYDYYDKFNLFAFNYKTPGTRVSTTVPTTILVRALHHRKY